MVFTSFSLPMKGDRLLFGERFIFILDQRLVDIVLKFIERVITGQEEMSFTLSQVNWVLSKIRDENG